MNHSETNCQSHHIRAMATTADCGTAWNVSFLTTTAVKPASRFHHLSPATVTPKAAPTPTASKYGQSHYHCHCHSQAQVHRHTGIGIGTSTVSVMIMGTDTGTTMTSVVATATATAAATTTASAMIVIILWHGSFARTYILVHAYIWIISKLSRN